MVVSQDVPPELTDLSGAVEDLIRVVATKALDPEYGVLAEVEAAALGPIQERFVNFPTLSEETLASTRQNVTYWLRSMQGSPLSRIEPTLVAPVIGLARSLTRRGAAQDLWAAYSAGREALWRAWMRIAFESAPDVGILNDSLNVASTSLSRWVDETVLQINALVEQENRNHAGATHELKLQTATRILDGTPMDEELAAYRLKYPLVGEHIAAIIWTDPAAPDQPALRQVAEKFAACATQHQAKALVVPATSSSIWVWVNNPNGDTKERLIPIVAGAPQVRLALGSIGAGIDGFRRSHYEAVEAQRLMVRVGSVQMASFDDVALAALGAHNEQAAREFVARILGDLGSADQELRDTVRVYIRHMYNASKTADEVYAHRNTVFHRIQRAEELLPRPLAVSGVEVGVALELQRWLA
ncbi:MAG TPA: helix-turn-helix domain-containing protein [Aeromicrobium sp.]|nr:helix-turn-helix domain-containing protein [Aeromicrobium sp.]HKY56734.1 helix-turn-helix domain-containing protein [Aeromicrobium sp.]